MHNPAKPLLTKLVGLSDLGFYVGNKQITTKTEDEAVTLHNKATKGCLAVYMPLQSWNTSSV